MYTAFPPGGLLSGAVWGAFSWGFSLPLLCGEPALTTIPQFLEARFGKKVAHAVLLAMVMGTFLSVVAQFFAGKALLRNLLPLSELQGTLLVALLVLGFYLLRRAEKLQRLGGGEDSFSLRCSGNMRPGIVYQGSAGDERNPYSEL